MKTSVNMVRKLDVFDVIQRTKDSMFNATVLMEQWNEYSGQKKNINHYLDNAKTKEFIIALIDDDFNIRKSERPVDQIVIRGRCKTLSSGGKDPGTTWMHPLLFIDFAMWLNPSFKVKVLKFVYDNLIAFRHSCGDNYIGLTASVSKFPDVDYPRLARALNYVVFGKHYSNIRNDASEAQLQELRSLEEKLSYAIDKEYIQGFPELIEALRKDWANKWRKF